MKRSHNPNQLQRNRAGEDSEGSHEEHQDDSAAAAASYPQMRLETLVQQMPAFSLPELDLSRVVADNASWRALATVPCSIYTESSSHFSEFFWREHERSMLEQRQAMQRHLDEIDRRPSDGRCSSLIESFWNQHAILGRAHATPPLRFQLTWADHLNSVESLNRFLRDKGVSLQTLLQPGASYFLFNRRTRGDKPCPFTHIAAYFASGPVMDVLIRNGLDPHLRTRDGETPLHFAAASHNAESLVRLVIAGGDVNAQDCMGCTALHKAAMNYAMHQLGTADCIVILLRAGADKEIRNHEEKKAFDLKPALFSDAVYAADNWSRLFETRPMYDDARIDPALSLRETLIKLFAHRPGITAVLRCADKLPIELIERIEAEMIRILKFGSGADASLPRMQIPSKEALLRRLDLLPPVVRFAP